MWHSLDRVREKARVAPAKLEIGLAFWRVSESEFRAKRAHDKHSSPIGVHEQRRRARLLFSLAIFWRQLSRGGRPVGGRAANWPVAPPWNLATGSCVCVREDDVRKWQGESVRRRFDRVRASEWSVWRGSPTQFGRQPNGQFGLRSAAATATGRIAAPQSLSMRLAATRGSPACSAGAGAINQV